MPGATHDGAAHTMGSTDTEIGTSRAHQELLTTREVAARAGVKADSVVRWIRSGKLRATLMGGQPGGHAFLIDAEEAARFIASRHGRPTADMAKVRPWLGRSTTL
jgi:excisionase family DNA binding protein